MDQKTVKDILRCHEVPMNYESCRDLWRKVMFAFKKDTSVKVLETELYDRILEFRKTNYKTAYAFLYDYDVTKEPDGYSLEIAQDGEGGVLKYTKDKNGVGFLYTTNDPRLFVRFGFTKYLNGYMHPFYQSCGVSVMYHFSDNMDGQVQTIRTLGGTKHYDENGNCSLRSNFFGAIDDFVNLIE